MELLKVRGGSAVESAAKWAMRAMDLGKAGMWCVLAADAWLKLGKPLLASACLEEAERLYAGVLDGDGVFPMPEIQEFIDSLRHDVKVEYLENGELDTQDQAIPADPLETEEISEKLDKRMNRKSLINSPLESAGGLNLGQGMRDNDNPVSDDFERA
ncbi:hypothetical protein EYZ11_000576 [Aspergillus tanneri]|uniref:Uncharacterized protein n=1 Tax=Aspergillus tanneri TaxID=1220188 RepID=A0A4S3JX25_9EURO|nr:hypothetical protein EYZ11_000576 [Aspergillus tanneri]